MSTGGAPFTCEFRTPGAGIEVSNYALETQCAMECYQQNNCSKYLYNELDKKCTHMTPYDFNFLGEEFIEKPENYQLKVQLQLPIKYLFHNKLPRYIFLILLITYT